MSAHYVRDDVNKNAATMSGKLPSSQLMKRFDNCCGIHGAARRRKGIKRGTSAARRRVEKEILKGELYEATTAE